MFAAIRDYVEIRHWAHQPGRPVRQVVLQRTLIEGKFLLRAIPGGVKTGRRLRILLLPSRQVVAERVAPVGWYTQIIRPVPFRFEIEIWLAALMPSTSAVMRERIDARLVHVRIGGQIPSNVKGPRLYDKPLLTEEISGFNVL